MGHGTQDRPPASQHRSRAMRNYYFFLSLRHVAKPKFAQKSWQRQYQTSTCRFDSASSNNTTLSFSTTGELHLDGRTTAREQIQDVTGSRSLDGSPSPISVLVVPYSPTLPITYLESPWLSMNASVKLKTMFHPVEEAEENWTKQSRDFQSADTYIRQPEPDGGFVINGPEPINGAVANPIIFTDTKLGRCIKYKTGKGKAIAILNLSNVIPKSSCNDMLLTQPPIKSVGFVNSTREYFQNGCVVVNSDGVTVEEILEKCGPSAHVAVDLGNVKVMELEYMERMRAKGRYMETWLTCIRVPHFDRILYIMRCGGPLHTLKASFSAMSTHDFARFSFASSTSTHHNIRPPPTARLLSHTYLPHRLRSHSYIHRDTMASGNEMTPIEETFNITELLEGLLLQVPEGQARRMHSYRSKTISITNNIEGSIQLRRRLWFDPAPVPHHGDHWLLNDNTRQITSLVPTQPLLLGPHLHLCQPYTFNRDYLNDSANGPLFPSQMHPNRANGTLAINDDVFFIRDGRKDLDCFIVQPPLTSASILHDGASVLVFNLNGIRVRDVRDAMKRADPAAREDWKIWIAGAVFVPQSAITHVREYGYLEVAKGLGELFHDNTLHWNAPQGTNKQVRQRIYRHLAPSDLLKVQQISKPVRDAMDCPAVKELLFYTPSQQQQTWVIDMQQPIQPLVGRLTDPSDVHRLW
ncbi:hypothetical protein M409DRAFT_60375 [Zasmidium cellare ATCC 36951]|uniref:Uncharacterized protein n=1 Tax=Zasmidium cellare ATCC 36951 TaxID=1080233 RepID=A0A6A6C297_ZASCE|nr:uncharacterized protein M409DRAFT_60375 [Zasmidium cellare ATCC 36951]KAF2159972.1 hypothetical protein M409DRAFT_60375 [Zasmidium cellare ATCC 36951]